MIAAELEFDAIDQFCRRQPIQRLALFGSVLRDDFGLQSDVDFLVKYVPGARVGFFDVAGMELELSQIIGGVDDEE